MKQLLLICAVVALVGCGGNPEPSPSNFFADPLLEAAARKDLSRWEAGGNPIHRKLTKADLERVTNLELQKKQLTDVPKGLENFPQLMSLSLGGNQLTSVKGLENFTGLEELALHENKLTDVKGLENLTQLKELTLSDNQLTDVKGLENLTKLEELNLAGNQLANVKGLEKLTQLTSLMLYDNPDLGLAQIAELKKALPKCTIIGNFEK